MSQLLVQHLVEGQCTRLGARVICHLTQRHEARHTGHCDYMAVVVFDHVWQELPDSPEMRHSVNFEGQADLSLGLIKNRAIVSHTSVVDNDGGFALVGADLVRDCFDGG